MCFNKKTTFIKNNIHIILEKKVVKVKGGWQGFNRDHLADILLVRTFKYYVSIWTSFKRKE